MRLDLKDFIPHFANYIPYYVSDPKDYLNCHFAASPAHGVLTRGNAAEDEIENYQSLLEQVANAYGPYSQNTIFDGKVFSKRAIGLDRTPPGRMSYIKYLGQGYIKAISSLEGCQ